MTDDQTVAELAGDAADAPAVVRQAGVSFERSYVSYPVCCPSRATYLTGQYAHNHGVMGLYPPTGGYGRFDKRNALPVWLQRGGYHTAHLGKFLNGYGDQEPADVPPGWSDWHATVDYSTYSMWGYTINHNGRMRTYGRPFVENPRLYQTDVLARQAASIVKRRRAAQAALPVRELPRAAPRGPPIQRRTGALVRPAPRHRGRLREHAPPARRRASTRRDMSDKPRFLRRRTHPLRRRRDRRASSATRAQRRAALLAVDDGVARIVAALRRAAASSTRRTSSSPPTTATCRASTASASGKMLPYDPSTRVPLLMRGPGIPRGAVSRASWWRTSTSRRRCSTLAGARAGKTVDGRSLLPFAREPGRTTRRAILHETGGKRLLGPREQDEGDAPGGVVARVSLPRGPHGALALRAYRDGSRELYDLRRDPDQIDSLHDGRAHPRIRRVLRRELNRLATCAGAGCTRTAPRWTVRRGLEGGDSVSS